KPSIDLKVDSDGVAILNLQRPPVNSFNLDFLKEMSHTLDFVEKNKITAMILTSAFPKVFSAGLDIKEIYKPDAVRFKEFWSTLQEVWMKLFGASFITAAAINASLVTNYSTTNKTRSS
ncbi:enoyl-CoA isomerase, partial [Danaus plexippus plexippus]